jgi:hypothetical protein
MRTRSTSPSTRDPHLAETFAARICFSVLENSFAGCLLIALASTSFPQTGSAQLPTWVVEAPARPALSALWQASISARAERVACVSGRIGRDTVWISGAAPVVTSGADSLTAEGEPSLAQCGPPRWIGTVHTHIRSTDDPDPALRFSPGDRAQMSEWVRRWGRPGAFCVLYSASGAHCEVYPWREPRDSTSSR